MISMKWIRTANSWNTAQRKDVSQQLVFEYVSCSAFNLLLVFNYVNYLIGLEAATTLENMLFYLYMNLWAATYENCRLGGPQRKRSANKV